MVKFSKWRVAPIMTLQFFGGMGASMIVTFYPREASKLGISPAQFGVVFGIIHVTVFLSGEWLLDGSRITLKIRLCFQGL